MRFANHPAFALGLVVVVAIGCQRFFLPVASPAATAADKETAIRENNTRDKYFILRHGSGNYAMTGVAVDREQLQLRAQLSPLPEAHKVYTRNRNNYRYSKNKGEDVVLDEVHLYLSGTGPLDTAKTISLPLDSIQKIEVIQFDKGRTTTSYILGGVGIALATVATTVAIILATKESCPFVSVYDGSEYVVQGELFGGAIYPSLARQDYVPLRAQPLDGDFQVRISNELQEKQFTDFADLWVIAHDKGVRALTDRSGKIYTVGGCRAPAKALLNNRRDVTPALEATDKWLCLFDDTSATDNVNELVLHFDKPARQKEGKLLLQVKNSYWFDYLYGEFSSAFGSYYDTWIKKQKKVPAADLHQWAQQQHIPLLISLKTRDGWKQVEWLKTIGPLTNREVLVPLDLRGVEGDEVVVKLTTGFMFWELDYAGMDYSPQRPFTVQTLSPCEGLDEKGRDILPAVARSDGKYLDQPEAGCAAVLKYKLRERATDNQALSVVLHTGGYYEHVRHFKGKPRLEFLRGFKQPGAFAAFSRQQYERVLTQNLIAHNQ